MKRARKKETRGNKNPQYLKKSKERDDDKHSIYLPVDLIIEILTRLRPRSLSKLICVSKLWSSIIQGKYFTNLYLTRSSTRPLLLFHSYSYQTGLSRYSSPSSLHSITLPGYQTYLSPPVRGLICCADDDSNAVIGNPSTGQFFTLPSVYDLSLKGIFLGYEPVDDLYKVLSMNLVIARPGASIVGERCQVLTLGAQESWRTIDCEYNFYPLTQGICLNGVVYYGAHSSSSEENCYSVLVSFDLRFEEFSLITLPEGVHILRLRSDLVIYNGDIAFVIHSPNGKFDLWHLIDVNKQEWTKVSVVVPCWRDLFGDDDLRVFFCGNLIRCMGTINTGELIFATCYSQKHPSFLCYDPKEDKSRMVYIARNVDSYYYMNIFLNHVESPMFLPSGWRLPVFILFFSLIKIPHKIYPKISVFLGFFLVCLWITQIQWFGLICTFFFFFRSRASVLYIIWLNLQREPVLQEKHVIFQLSNSSENVIRDPSSPSLETIIATNFHIEEYLSQVS